MLDERARAGIDELAKVFCEAESARALLDAVGYPRSRLPRFSEPFLFWNEAAQKLGNGLIKNGLHILWVAAAQLYPANVVLTNLAAGAHETASRPGFDDADLRRHSEELTQLYEKKRARTIAGDNTRDVIDAIRRQKDAQRRGPDLAPGARLYGGRFEILEALGRGGFGRVWKAWDEDARACVAVKVLFPHLLDERSKVERFLRGARWMSELRHPHIVAVHEPHLVDEDDGWHFFVMDWVDGPDLERAVLEEELADDAKIRVIQRIGEALEHAHGKSLVHRDVKPSNVLLDSGLEPKLTDFDLVRADDTDTPYTATHAMMGTLNFAAPELLHSPRDAGPPSDVYSLASTAVFVLSGEKLPVGYYMNPGKAIEKLGFEPALTEVLTRATLMDPQRRYATAGAFIEAFTQAGEPPPPPAEPVPSPPPAGPTPPPPPVPRRPKARSVTKPPPEELFRWVDTPHDGRVELWRDIPAGAFQMGSTQEESTWDNERPRYQVTVRSPFQMAAVPVTNAQYAVFNPDQADGNRPDHPVVNVSWHDAMKFCDWLSRSFEWTRGVRLPTEEEWEYACRAGTETRYWSGDEKSDLARVGWFGESSDGRIHTVGEKPANSWGLYDVHGNVWEWTLSPWISDYRGRETGHEIDSPAVKSVDIAATSGDLRVIRGGSCWDDAAWTRAAYRFRGDPGGEHVSLGFRLLLPTSAPKS